MLRTKVAVVGPDEWITGFDWDEVLLAERRNTERADLDAVAPANPVVLTHAGAHSSVERLTPAIGSLPRGR
jgi:predicted amidohydrolase YtcJ